MDVNEYRKIKLNESISGTVVVFTTPTEAFCQKRKDMQEEEDQLLKSLPSDTGDERVEGRVNSRLSRLNNINISLGEYSSESHR